MLSIALYEFRQASELQLLELDRRGGTCVARGDAAAILPTAELHQYRRPHLHQTKVMIMLCGNRRFQRKRGRKRVREGEGMNNGEEGGKGKRET